MLNNGQKQNEALEPSEPRLALLLKDDLVFQGQETDSF